MHACTYTCKFMYKYKKYIHTYTCQSIYIHLLRYHKNVIKTRPRQITPDSPRRSLHYKLTPMHNTERPAPPATTAGPRCVSSRRKRFAPGDPAVEPFSCASLFSGFQWLTFLWWDYNLHSWQLYFVILLLHLRKTAQTARKCLHNKLFLLFVMKVQGVFLSTTSVKHFPHNQRPRKSLVNVYPELNCSFSYGLQWRYFLSLFLFLSSPPSL